MFRLFEANTDLEIINTWARAYGLPDTKEEHLPTIGLIGDHVCGFLYQTDSSVCYIDNVIANRGNHTDQDLDRLVLALEEVGRSLGFRYCFAYSSKFPVISLGKRHGYEVTPRFSQMTKVL